MMTATIATLWPISQAPATDWQASGHDLTVAWYLRLGEFGPWVLAASLLVVLVLSALRRGRYRAVAALDEADREVVHEALRAAEARTVGEIVPVVLGRSDDHPAADWLSGLAFLLVGTAVLAPHMPWEHPAAIVACQLVFLGLGYGAARVLPPYKRLFIRSGRAAEVAAEQAFQEFYGNDLHETEAATGVLLFVSLLEHRVIVLGDHGIAAVVPGKAWEETDAAILAGIRAGSLRDGLVEGIRLAGEVLAGHFPYEDGNRNELPDRLIIRHR